MVTWWWCHGTSCADRIVPYQIWDGRLRWATCPFRSSPGSVASSIRKSLDTVDWWCPCSPPTECQRRTLRDRCALDGSPIHWWAFVIACCRRTCPSDYCHIIALPIEGFEGGNSQSSLSSMDLDMTSTMSQLSSNSILRGLETPWSVDRKSGRTNLSGTKSNGLPKQNT